MPKPIRINLDTSRYVTPTEQQIAEAKQYILRRNDNAALLEELANDLLTDAAVKVIEIAYKYNFPGDVFTIGASPEQQAEISAVMDELDERLFELLEETIVNNVTTDRDRRMALLAFMLALGHANQNLRNTLFNYEWRFLYDLEAAIAAMKIAGVSLSEAITRIRSNITAIYTMSEVQTAIRNPGNAMAAFIRSSGVPYNPDGSPNLQGVPREGYNAIINSIRITNDIIWGRNQLLNYIDSNAAGFYVLRGSDYPCKMCDDNTGFHTMNEQEALPPIHPHCCCYSIPIFEKL